MCSAMMSELSILGVPVAGIERMNVSQAIQEPGQPKQPPDLGQSRLEQQHCVNKKQWKWQLVHGSPNWPVGKQLSI